MSIFIYSIYSTQQKITPCKLKQNQLYKYTVTYPMGDQT